MYVGDKGGEVFAPSVATAMTLLPPDQWVISRSGDTLIFGIAVENGWRYSAAVSLGDFLNLLAARDDRIRRIIDPVKRPAV